MIDSIGFPFSSLFLSFSRLLYSLPTVCFHIKNHIPDVGVCFRYFRDMVYQSSLCRKRLKNLETRMFSKQKQPIECQWAVKRVSLHVGWLLIYFVDFFSIFYLDRILVLKNDSGFVGSICSRFRPLYKSWINTQYTCAKVWLKILQSNALLYYV